MTDDNPVPLHSVESIVAAIKALPGNERLRLINQMKGNHEWLLGHVMVSKELGLLMVDSARLQLQSVREFRQLLVETANEAHRRGNCSLTRKQKTEARNKHIYVAIAGGIDENDDQAIFDYVRNQDATLLRKKQSGKELIEPKNMMAVYHRTRESKNNCNRSE
jgi:hypothetical protein